MKSLEEAVEILTERKNVMEYVTDNDDWAFDMAVASLEAWNEVIENIEKDIDYYTQRGGWINKEKVRAMSADLALIKEKLGRVKE